MALLHYFPATLMVGEGDFEDRLRGHFESEARTCEHCLKASPPKTSDLLVEYVPLFSVLWLSGVILHFAVVAFFCCLSLKSPQYQILDRVRFTCWSCPTIWMSEDKGVYGEQDAYVVIPEFFFGSKCL